MRKLLCALVLLVTSCTPVWVIEGWAAGTTLNYNGMQISAGALEKGAEALGEYRTVLFNHDNNRPVGRILTIEFRNDKLYVTIAVSRAEEALWQKIREGVVTGLSLNWTDLEPPTMLPMGPHRPGELSTLIFIREISIVSIPANPDCRITNWRVRYE